MTKNKKGFTLIELLVVIAIIGILASVVLASLNSARSKGQEAAIKSTVNNARAAAELYYDDQSNSYLDVCTATSGILQFVTGADTAGALSVGCGDSDTAYALEAQLNATPEYYCVDSSGAAETDGAPKSSTSSVVCS